MNRHFLKCFLTALALVAGGLMPVHASKAYAPFGQFSKQPWQAKCLIQYYDSNGWFTDDFDDAGWTTVSGPVSKPNALAYYASQWGDNSGQHYFRRHFNVDRLDQNFYAFYITHDAGCRAYLNGVQIYRKDDCTSASSYNTVYIPKELLRTGDNLLAVAVEEGNEQSFCDFGLYGEEDLPWTSVELASPGTLGQEVLYQVDVLSDVEYLKVKGTMNDDDWVTIKNMANLKGVDLSEAMASRVPDEQFRDRSNFYIALLPSGIKTIGEAAFCQTSLTGVIIPASVTSIGRQAFYGCQLLGSAEFVAGSQLSSLGYDAFYHCSMLKAIVLPASLTALEDGVFCECSLLASVTLPPTLTSIGYNCFYNTSSLYNIDLPSTLTRINSSAFAYSGLESLTLPQNLNYLGEYAFGGCPRLKQVELPVTSVSSNSWDGRGYYNTFGSCTAIEQVICPSATPPAVYSDPFSGLDRSKVTLVVPAFAVVDYKLDTYWHEFGTIKEGADPAVLNLSGMLTLTNNRRPANKVDVVLNQGARLTVGGNAPFEVGTLTINANLSEKTFGQLLNHTTAMSADRVTSRCWVYSNLWYFITPLHDVNVADITHSNAEASFIFYRYNAQNRAVNGPQGSWQAPINNILRAGQGYIVQTNREGWITMPATADSKDKALVSADATTPLVTNNASNNADANWNFVGNPYTCYYDTYYMDLAAPITVWDYDAWTYRAYSPIDDDYVLSPMEAFFVQKPASLSQVLFRQEGRQFTPDVQRVDAARRIQGGSRRLFDLRVSDGSHADMTRVVFNADASTAYEPACDAAKFFATAHGEAAVPQLYTIDGQGNRLAINERPAGAVRLGLLTTTGGTFTLSLTRGHGSLLLTDAVTGQTVDLSQHDYTFTLEGSNTADSRFTLHLSDEATGIENVGRIQTQNSTCYDLQGRRLNSQPRSGLYIKEGKKLLVK